MPIEIKSPYPMSSLIRDCGEGDFQFLASCLSGNQKKVRLGTQITFIAPIPLMDLIRPEPSKIGVVVWLDGDNFREIQAAIRENRPANPK